MMGMPGFTEDLEREFNEGRVQFGGCVITYDIDNGGHSSDPERVCNSCGTEWGRWVAPQSPWPR